jgi:plastocyanin
MRLTCCVVLLLALTACQSSGDPYSPNPPPPAPPPAPPPPPPPPGSQFPATAAVSLGSVGDGYGGSRFAFTPEAVSIRIGGTVTWNNPTGIAHTVTFAPVSGAPASIASPAAGMQSRTFPIGGQFAYACTIHPEMTGQVNVQ